MAVECVARPSLREPVQQLMTKVNGEHAGGPFQIPLIEIFRSFGLSFSRSAWDDLEDRGAVKFTPRGPAQGSFSNSGRELELAAEDGLIIVIPAALGGDYVTTTNSLTLKFDEGSALRGCKRIFVRICQDIIKIDLNEHQLYIDLPGEKYDLCFIF